MQTASASRVLIVGLVSVAAGVVVGLVAAGADANAGVALAAVFGVGAALLLVLRHLSDRN